MGPLFEGADRLGFTGVMQFGGKPLELDWWQRDYVARNDRFIALVKSRRTGWSFAVSVKGVIKSQDWGRKKYTKIFVSYNLADAIEKIEYCKELYHSIPERYRKKLVGESKTYMEFLDRDGKTKSRLISFPCKPPRGKDGDVSLDEFAFYQGSDKVYTGSLPTIIRGGHSLEIGSTPYGQKGRFHEIYTDAKSYPNYKRFWLPWYYSAALCKDIVAASADRELSSEERVTKWGTDAIIQQFYSMPFEDFQQEFECSFRDEAASFITLEMIQHCTPLGDDEVLVARSIEELALTYDPDVHGTLYAGFDVGRKRDASELFVLAKNGDAPLRSIAKVTWNQKPFDDQEQALNELFSRLPIHRLCIDSTGMGEHLAENLKRRHGPKVENVIFTTEVKENLANELYLTMQRRDILLPADRELGRQIHSIKRTITSAGSVRFDAEREGNSHADQFWALALAVSAADKKKRRIGSVFYAQLREKQRVQGTQGGRVRPVGWGYGKGR